MFRSVSVVVPTRNRPAMLAEALDSLGAQQRVPDEVVVVDDASEPAVEAAALRGRLPAGCALQVVRNTQSRGLASARHQGALAARGELLMHLDDDDKLAPGAVEACARALERDPRCQLLFLGVRGFGSGAERFQRVHREGTCKVLAAAGARRLDEDTHLLEAELLSALLERVPMPFQRWALRRETWMEISALRLEAYRTLYGLPSEEAAMARITGPLRDCEWVLYAALVCQRALFLDQPLYLQRCEGQGYSSRPAMAGLHGTQQLLIKENLRAAARCMPALRSAAPLLTSALADTCFSAAYASSQRAERAAAWRQLRRALSLRCRPRYLRLLPRLLLPVSWSRGTTGEECS